MALSAYDFDFSYFIGRLRRGIDAYPAQTRINFSYDSILLVADYINIFPDRTPAFNKDKDLMNDHR